MTSSFIHNDKILCLKLLSLILFFRDHIFNLKLEYIDTTDWRSREVCNQQ